MTEGTSLIVSLAIAFRVLLDIIVFHQSHSSYSRNLHVEMSMFQRNHGGRNPGTQVTPPFLPNSSSQLYVYDFDYWKS